MRAAVDRLWYSPSPIQKILIIFLLPLSFVFGLLVRIRQGLYRLGLLRADRIAVPVWVIGNLTVGGNGKTPFVIEMALALKEKGVSVGIISRGYGGCQKGPLILSDETQPLLAGDEACLMFQKTRCPVVVGRDRAGAARTLLQHYPHTQLILSDDGLQHLALQRDREWVLVDPRRGFGNGLLLPAGPLREPLSRLQTVDQIMETPPYVIECVYNLWAPEKTIQLSDLKGKKIHAVAGIADPMRFFQTLRAHDLSIEAHPFPDHVAYRAFDFQFAAGSPIIMTEKDAVKCRLLFSPSERPEIWVLSIRLQLSEEQKKDIETCFQAQRDGCHDRRDRQRTSG